MALPVAPQASPKLLASKSVTVPVAPTLNIEKRFSQSTRSIQQLLSSEEMELAKVAAEKQTERALIARNKQMYAKLKAKGFQKVASAVKSSMKKLTVPKGPKSVLDNRHGVKVPSATKRSPKKASQPTTAACTSPRACTIPVPFNFATDVRIKVVDKESTLTAGEQAQRFMADPRSHHVPANAAKKVTEPHSPLFLSKQRGQVKEKQPNYEERLEAEMAEMLKHTFKARHLDRRIFESNGELGVPKVEAKALTVPQEFHLEIDKRTREKKPADEEVSAPFKALPLPDFSLSRQPSTPAAVQFKPTLPVSPKLHGGDRASSAPSRRQRPHHKEQEKQRAEEADAWRKAKVASRVTEPLEFHLLTSDRGQAYQHMLEEYQRQEEELAKEAVKVKAMPLPDLSKSFHIKPSTKTVTAPAPFELKSAILHEEAEVKLHQQLDREGEQVRKSNSFRARAVPKTTYEPQLEVGETENRPPTVPLNVKLSSDSRAEKRHAFDVQVAEKKTLQQKQEEQKVREKEEAEQRELHDLRRKSVQDGGMVFKAQPVLRHDPYATKRPVTPKAVTMPKSPKYHLKERRVKVEEVGKPADAALPKRMLGGGAKRVTAAMPR